MKQIGMVEVAAAEVEAAPSQIVDLILMQMVEVVGRWRTW